MRPLRIFSDVRRTAHSTIENRDHGRTLFPSLVD
jgi:hypothetical protein